MKIAVEELRPNPFRDITRYPMHREKIESLKASIRSTGFWDNVLVRKAEKGEHYEVAYGHHRLAALKELINEKVIEAGLMVDVPVRKLDDATMIRIMANENMEQYRVTSDIIDETVRVAREFIMKETRTPMHEITASDVSQFLGGGWTEEKVGLSLQRLGLFDRGTIHREQLKGLSHTAAKAIQREVAKVEKTMTRKKLEDLEEDDEEVSEQERKRVRQQVQKVANHVAGELAKHIRDGGGLGELKEKSFDIQAECIPEDAPPDERQLSTIDAAAKGVHAREFQRKVEMLLKYKDYMSDDARRELKGRVQEVGEWCRKITSEF